VTASTSPDRLVFSLAETSIHGTSPPKSSSITPRCKSCWRTFNVVSHWERLKNEGMNHLWIRIFLFALVYGNDHWDIPCKIVSSSSFSILGKQKILTCVINVCQRLLRLRHHTLISRHNEYYNVCQTGSSSSH